MYLVALETSSARGGVALIRVGPDATAERVDELPFAEGLVHGRECNVQLDALLRRRRLRPGDVGAVAVSLGPGSYTGIRVGVTVAKTLAFAMGLPLVPVSSLAVIAGNAASRELAIVPGADPASPPHVSADSTKAGSGELAVVLDGKQGHLYRALFRVDAGNPRRAMDDGVESLQALGDRGFPEIPAGATLIGDGAELALSRLPAGLGYRRGPPPWDWPRAGVLGILAARELEAGAALREREAIHRLQPVYMRLSEAERRFRARALRRGES